MGNLPHLLHKIIPQPLSPKHTITSASDPHQYRLSVE
ncbi:hypothetical protein J010_03370 [Cryptococcus neoformans]|uniref:Uncharacterized protein n=1 Tax=Cryptococcus neoformans Tu259-1 TaxID=1230072 RepID=A0A854QD59_CRYNE|nr:hypothetical protein C353_03467 [Cryptococcus neoformans var. grubii AD1-83a]OWZ54377.1 hypothetical protein C368_03520 [Cryptococcus neoformans var. grubii 125.91]OXG20790.1 hypothetical protein C361_03768 [Cryptococcus neoformans var. grubii Tu259-1]OXG50029.1 hypothetical protein C355_02992 [Cryptococcus neoformans var. grubii Th84]OXG58938.1 hypothetical protein C354_03404 [Cryptococcus neoformans var. grubii MW-RSA1955]OXG63516.1 hypothetical protein C351_03192 [Cryptococcus neoformans